MRNERFSDVSLLLKFAVSLLAVAVFSGIMWSVMPRPARGDRILFANLTLTVGFILIGLVGFVLGEPRSVTYLTLGVLASIPARAFHLTAHRTA